MARRDFPMNLLQGNVTILQEWCKEQIASIKKREEEADNNSYEAAGELMLLQGKRRVVERFFMTSQFSLDQPIAECRRKASEMLNDVIEHLGVQKSKVKGAVPMSLLHSRTLGEYSMLCDIERKLLSLE